MVDLYIHSPIRLHGVLHRDNFSFYLYHTGLEVHTAVVLFWDITSCFNGLHGVISQNKELFNSCVNDHLTLHSMIKQDEKNTDWDKRLFAGGGPIYEE
jgi:hypothetical protein